MSLFADIKKNFGSFQLNIRLDTGGRAGDHGAQTVLGILGASGAGKSLTLKCIAGLIRPDAGRIVLNGRTLFDSEKRINLPPRKRHVGYLFQNYALFPHMTVYENVLCALSAEKSRAAKGEAAKRALSLMELWELRDRRPGQLSGGQKQRAALSRIIASRPEILLFDEPFSALDSHLREKLAVELQLFLQNMNLEAVIVSHNRDEIYKLCSDTAVLEQGTVLLQKDTKALFADPEILAASILTGCKNHAAAVPASGQRVFVPEWGITLETGREVPADITHVGIRAHSFSEKISENAFPVKDTAGTEEPFEQLIRFRYASQDPSSEMLWQRRPKGNDILPDRLGVRPAEVLLLRKRGFLDEC